MKRILGLVFVFLLIALVSFATEVNTKVSSNTVTFSTTALIVTFNSVTTNVMVENNTASGSALYVNLNDEYIGWNTDHSQYIFPIANSQNTVRLLPGDSIAVDIATKKIGFIGEGTGMVTYVVMGERDAL